MIEPRELPAAHDAYVRVLSNTSLAHSRVATLPTLYDAVAGLVAQAEARVGKVRIGHLDSPMLAWHDVREQDLAEMTWYRAGLQEFDSPPLFAPGDEPQLRDNHYREIMNRKIASVGQRLSFAVDRRIPQAPARPHRRHGVDRLGQRPRRCGRRWTYDDLLKLLD